MPKPYSALKISNFETSMEHMRILSSENLIRMMLEVGP